MSIPPEEEVEEGRYHYYKCPLNNPPPMPANLFLHYMKCAANTPSALKNPEAHKDAYFLNRLPKKLKRSIFSESDTAQPFGWGVRIMEGPNKVALSWMTVLGIILSFVTSVIYAVVAKTQEQGFGIGQWMMAVFTAVLAALYFQWEEG
jgi:hypothetical protein